MSVRLYIFKSFRYQCKVIVKTQAAAGIVVHVR